MSRILSTEERRYSLRPLSRRIDDSTLENAFRIFMSTADMSKEDVKQGDYVSLRSESSGAVGVAIVTRSPDSHAGGSHKMNLNPIIRMQEWLRERYGFELKDKYYLEKWPHRFQPIETITVTNITSAETPPSAVEELKHEVFAALASLEGIGVGGTFDVIPRWKGARGKKQRFLVDEIDPQGDKSLLMPYVYSLSSSITFKNLTTPPAPPESPVSSVIEIEFNGLFGLDKQLAKIKRSISIPAGNARLPILVLGSENTGKTSVLEQLKQANWNLTIEIDRTIITGGDNKVTARLESVFKQAEENSPSLITIDDIDMLVGKDDQSGLPKTLKRLILRSKINGVQVIAAAERTLDIQRSLCNAFKRKIELTLPNAQARFQILNTLEGGCDVRVLGRVAERTHAYTAEDLDTLKWDAYDEAMQRLERHPEDSSRAKSFDGVENVVNPKAVEEDYERAMAEMIPAAMNEVYVEVPKVRWTDIGGSEGIKDYLQDIVMNIGKDQNGPAYFAVEPIRGLLLYGPPGCSKTMTARALATESGFNFLSVKGPELVSKWVGETEYNIREVFRKAKEAAPAVIFFDEFDGLAKSTSGHDSLSPVKALLTELDGVQPLKRVLVVAATNRPELIDAALLRPGRFDKLVYTGPPNLEARIQILQIHTKNRHLQESVDLQELASRTENWSGAELVALCNTAAQKAQNDFNKDHTLNRLTQRHFELAFKEVKPQISEEVLREFESWSASVASMKK